LLAKSTRPQLEHHSRTVYTEHGMAAGNARVLTLNGIVQCFYRRCAVAKRWAEFWESVKAISAQQRKLPRDLRRMAGVSREPFNADKLPRVNPCEHCLCSCESCKNCGLSE
jgi:hypothetical protein